MTTDPPSSQGRLSRSSPRRPRRPLRRLRLPTGYPSPPTGGYPQYPAGQQPPPGYGQPPGPQQSDSNTLSIIAMVLGGFAILFIPILLGPIAIILAVMAQRSTSGSRTPRSSWRSAA